MPSSCAPSTRRIRTFEPGREQRLVEANLVLVGELRRARLEVERRHARPREELHALLRVPLGRPEHDVLARLLAAHVGLRERRPVVGRVRLAPDHQDLSVGSLLTQVAGTVPGRHAAPHEQELDLLAQPPARNRVDLGRDRFPSVLLEEVRRALDHAQLAGARDQVDEPLAGLRE